MSFNEQLILASWLWAVPFTLVKIRRLKFCRSVAIAEIAKLIKVRKEDAGGFY